MTVLRWSDTLTAVEAAGVGALLAAAQAADGVGPVSDDVALTLRPGAGAALGRSHLLATVEAPGMPEVTGYAQLAKAGVGAWEAELVVHPAHRRQGIASALVEALVQAVADKTTTDTAAADTAGTDTATTDRAGTDTAAADKIATETAVSAADDAVVTLDVWAHGDTAAAAALAKRAGFGRGRVLLQLRRSLVTEDGELPEPVWPAGVTVRVFEPGRDEAAWLALNALAFASHPEQGRWTEQDLLPREAEPWFDPAGFFLAEQGGDLVGFHWTKVHAEDPNPPGGADAEPIGEVYVVGVDPTRAGGGLGRALTLAGLRHLRDRGLSAVMLYTDEDNTRAVRLYERLGFTRHAVDVQYRLTF